MTITRARWLPYALPLARPWRTATGVVDTRHGHLLRLETDAGLIGWGDAAPFPEIGISVAAARAHARECALLDLAAQVAAVPLARWLAPDRPPPPGIAVNAAIGPLDAGFPEAAAAALAAGYRVLKVKVGLADPAGEGALLGRLARDLPGGVSLRLDANGAWSAADAATFLAACRDLPIDGVEDPLRHPTVAALARLQAAVPFALAVDDGAGLVDAAFLERPPVRRLVLKPPRHGGLLATALLARRAQEAGLEVVFTSSLDSVCGVLATAHLAAAIAPRSCHGLASGGWFARDTGPGPHLAGGRLELPGEPGIGFRPWAIS